MDRMPAAETRQRVLNLIEETGSLLGMIPRLLDENEQLRASADTATKETDRLREELAALRSEIQQFRAERDEIAESFTKVMNDMVELMNEMIPKLRPGQKRSPFEREGHAAVAEPAARPTPAVSGFPWKQ